MANENLPVLPGGPLPRIVYVVPLDDDPGHRRPKADTEKDIQEVRERRRRRAWGEYTGRGKKGKKAE